MEIEEHISVLDQLCMTDSAAGAALGLTFCGLNLRKKWCRSRSIYIFFLRLIMLVRNDSKINTSI